MIYIFFTFDFVRKYDLVMFFVRYTLELLNPKLQLLHNEFRNFIHPTLFYIVKIIFTYFDKFFNFKWQLSAGIQHFHALSTDLNFSCGHFLILNKNDNFTHISHWTVSYFSLYCAIWTDLILLSLWSTTDPSFNHDDGLHRETKKSILQFRFGLNKVSKENIQ